MSWTRSLVDALVHQSAWTYAPGGPTASEVAALSSLAMAACDRRVPSRKPLEWMKRIQTSAGSVGVFADHDRPHWPTSLAVLAWTYHQQRFETNQFDDEIKRGTEWMLSNSGKTSPPTDMVGHDPTLAGWAWADGTHSWIEPTAFHVMALKAVGHAHHARTREAVRMLIDRQLPAGGCNYGNTIILGQELVAHAQPSGITLLALTEELPDSRIETSIKYLRREWPRLSGTASTCYSAMGLAAHGVVADDLEMRLTNQWELRSLFAGTSAFPMALLLLALLGNECPLITIQQPATDEVAR